MVFWRLHEQHENICYVAGEDGQLPDSKTAADDNVNIKNNKNWRTYGIQVNRNNGRCLKVQGARRCLPEVEYHVN